MKALFDKQDNNGAPARQRIIGNIRNKLVETFNSLVAKDKDSWPVVPENLAEKFCAAITKAGYKDHSKSEYTTIMEHGNYYDESKSKGDFLKNSKAFNSVVYQELKDEPGSVLFNTETIKNIWHEEMGETSLHNMHCDPRGNSDKNKKKIAELINNALKDVEDSIKEHGDKNVEAYRKLIENAKNKENDIPNGAVLACDGNSQAVSFLDPLSDLLRYNMSASSNLMANDHRAVPYLCQSLSCLDDKKLKRESFNRAMMWGSVAGGTLLTVATFGATAPLLAASASIGLSVADAVNTLDNIVYDKQHSNQLLISELSSSSPKFQSYFDSTQKELKEDFADQVKSILFDVGGNVTTFSSTLKLYKGLYGKIPLETETLLLKISQHQAVTGEELAAQ